MRRLFITGTDTDCGKTFISTQLIKFIQKQGFKSQGLKPVASGFRSHDVKSDVHLLEQVNATPGQSINLYAWEEAIAPHIAASLQQETICTDAVASFCKSNDFSNLDVLCIEGAGGLMMPLNHSDTWVDFIPKINAEVIFVVGMKLGCINHALLSFDSMLHHNIPCLGWIANCIDPTMAYLEANIDTLKERLPAPCLAINPYNGHLDDSFKEMGYTYLLSSIQASVND